MITTATSTGNANIDVAAPTIDPPDDENAKSVRCDLDADEVEVTPTTRSPSPELMKRLTRYMEIWPTTSIKDLPDEKLAKLFEFALALPFNASLTDNQLLWLHFFVVPSILFSDEGASVTINQIVEHFRTKGVVVNPDHLAAFFNDVFATSNEIVIGQVVLRCDEAKRAVTFKFDPENNKAFCEFLAGLMKVES